ncbi:MAG: ATP synthase F1 subunit delta [Clostridia bacterium]|nr:ATP synthase F1 subunit delta [Clostridia bacterium]
MTDLAREYGEALYQLARDEDLVQLIHEQLEDVRLLMRQQSDFVRLLTSRAIPRAERLSVVQETFANHVHPYVVNFMKLMVEKEHFDAFVACCKWYHRRFCDDEGIVEAFVTSAVPLSDEDGSALRRKLSGISGRQVRLITAVDQSLIGGVRVEMEGRRYDNTVQDRLVRFRQGLMEGL